VNSMARPNGNTTGVSILATELDDIESRTAQRSRRPSTWRRHPALQRLNVLASLMLYANRQLNYRSRRSGAPTSDLSMA
jgi:hypothetical protein